MPIIQQPIKAYGRFSDVKTHTNRSGDVQTTLILIVEGAEVDNATLFAQLQAKQPTSLIKVEYLPDFNKNL